MCCKFQHCCSVLDKLILEKYGTYYETLFYNVLIIIWKNYQNNQIPGSLHCKYTIQLYDHISHCHYMEGSHLGMNYLQTCHGYIVETFQDFNTIPRQVIPSNPGSQIQLPIESSQTPWLEHKPSAGQSNSNKIKYEIENNCWVMFYSLKISWLLTWAILSMSSSITSTFSSAGITNSCIVAVTWTLQFYNFKVWLC